MYWIQTLVNTVAHIDRQQLLPPKKKEKRQLIKKQLWNVLCGSKNA